MVPIGTAYFAGYMIEALCKCGLFSKAIRFIENHWGEFSKQGATTVWETWNTDQSLSHGWSAPPAVFAARHILGVQRADDVLDVYVPTGLKFLAGLPGASVKLNGQLIDTPTVILKNGVSYSAVELTPGSHQLKM